MAAQDSRSNLDGMDSPSSVSSSSSPATSPSPSTDDVPSMAAPPQQQQRSSTSSFASGMSTMTPSSTPLGPTNAARNRPGPMPTLSSSRSGMSSLPPDMAAKLQAFAAGRRGAPPAANLRTGAPPAPGAQPNLQSPSSPRVGAGGMGGVPAQFAGMSLSGRAPPPQAGPTGPIPNRGAPPRQLSMAERRGLNLGSGAAPAAGSAAPAKKGRPVMSLSSMNGGDASAPPQKQETMIDKFSEYLDKETGALNFKGKATLTNQGVKFASGKTFSISLDEVDTLDELGKGNYGTVYKVRHSRPKIRKVGQGLAGNKLSVTEREKAESDSPVIGSGTGVVMAMKEMRLELDDNKFATIIMELDVLHRCTSPYIVDFYGAFFQEGAVYICMEFMDGGSVDKLYGDGVPEGVLSKITLSTVLGLKSLKDEHNIIHRDVKPTNILVNTAGQVKICDFGVSGNLVASMAKTNIGCQSYMAPERINGGGIAQAGANPGGGTYSVQSDIWSLGLTIIECGLGRYPYPPETYDNIFSQLSAIVDGDPPDLPSDRFSVKARDFVSGCLLKIPNLRPTYAMLLKHVWLAELIEPGTITEEDEEAAEQGLDIPEQATKAIHTASGDEEVGAWVREAIERRRSGKMGKGIAPALHAAPLDAVPSPSAQR